MKFTFDRNAMIKEISIAQEIIATKNALSILSNIYLKAENNTLTIKATDTKVNFQTQVPVQVEEEGTTTVYCDKFIGILAALPEGEIEFDQKNEDEGQALNVIIRPTGKKIKFEMKSMSEDKFPEIEANSDAPFFDVSAKELKEMISHTVFAVSKDEQRMFMNGVYFEKNEDKLNMVATDGRRLSFTSKDILAGAPDFQNAIVHPKILGIILKYAGDEGSISFAIVEKMLYLRFGSYSFGAALINGQFPQYTRVIPKSQAHKVTVQRAELVNALKRVALMVDKKSGRIYLELDGGTMHIVSKQNELGSADEEIPAQYSEEPVSIAMNHRYIDEPLRLIDTENVTFEFTTEMSAVTMRPEPEGDHFHIIMPMQKE